MSELGVQVSLWRGHREACSQACRSAGDLQSCYSTMTQKCIWSWDQNPLPHILLPQKVVLLVGAPESLTGKPGPLEEWGSGDDPTHCRKKWRTHCSSLIFLQDLQERNFANAYRRKGLRGVLVESLNGCNRKVELTTVGSRGTGSRSTSSVKSKRSIPKRVHL